MSDGEKRATDETERPTGDTGCPPEGTEWSADGGAPTEEPGSDRGAGGREPPEPPEPPRSSQGSSASDPLPAPDRVARYIQWATLAAFLLLALVAGVGLYTSAGRVIQVWVASRYQPVVRTVFNAALLLVAAGGSAGVLRRLD